MGILQEPLNRAELLLVSLHRPFNVLEFLVHGVQLIGRHDVPRDLEVAPFGFFGKLEDFVGEEV